MSLTEILKEEIKNKEVKKLFNKYLDDGLYHVTTTKAIKNNKLQHPENGNLWFEFYYSEMMKEWKDEIVYEYGGNPLLIFLPKRNVKKYQWYTSDNDAELGYIFTKDKINLSDVKIKKLKKDEYN